MDKTTDILSFDAAVASKSGRAHMAADLIEQMKEGHIDPLQTHLHVKAMEDVMLRLTDKKKYPATAIPYCDMILEAAQKNGKSFSVGFGDFEVKETGVKYDYEVCGDPVITRLHAELEAIKAKVKVREDFLKKVPAGGLLVTDPETGETTMVYPPAKTSTTSVAVSLT